MTDGELILVGGALLATGLLATLIASRVQVPSLLLFLGIGMAIGSDGLGFIDFEDYELARTIGIAALALILFEGGLTAGLDEVRPILSTASWLALVGTVLTAVLAGLAATWLFDFSTLEGLLVGATLSATDGAAIFAALRNSTLERRLALTLEAESGFNDPVGILLVLGFIDWIEKPHYGLGDMVVLFVQELGIGLVMGVLAGRLAVIAFQRARLATAGLYPVATLATIGLAFGGADVLHGSGFLAVYVAALILGSANVPARQTVASFHQGMGWVAQLTMFLVLGLLVFPSQLGDVIVEGSVLAVVLVFVARPVAAWIATLPDRRLNNRERLLLGWAGLRGAVPVVLATFPVIEGVEDSLELFNIVFFAVVLSTLVQGSTFEALAKRLKLTTSQPALPRPLAEAGTIRRLGAEVLDYPIAPEDAIVGRRVRDLGLPRDAVVNVIVRGEEAIPPRGSTVLRAGDHIHVLVRTESARNVLELVSRWHTGPIGPPPRPPRRTFGRPPIFSTWAWSDLDGDPGAPRDVRGEQVIANVRIRRDVTGGLFALADGRYAVTGPVGAIGGRDDVASWARRRLRGAQPDERAWLRTVIGALASDRPE